MFNGNAPSILFYVSESCTFSSQLKGAREVADVVLGDLLRISWTEHLKEEVVLRKIETKKKKVFASRMKKEKVEDTATERSGALRRAGHVESKTVILFNFLTA